MTRIEIKEKDIITTGGDGMYTEDDDLAILVRDKNKLEQLKQQILQDYEMINQATKILINHCGETGKNEGLIETLQRLSETLERLDNEIRNTINYYDNGKTIPDPLLHHIKQCIRIKTGKDDVDSETLRRYGWGDWDDENEQ